MLTTKKVQNALLFCFHLAANGQVSVKDAAAHLSISPAFLGQIAAYLRKKGIVTSTRGPGSGYSLAPNTTLGHVITAFGNDPIVSDLVPSEGTPEHQHVVFIGDALTLSIKPLMNKPLSSIIQQVTKTESAANNIQVSQ